MNFKIFLKIFDDLTASSHELPSSLLCCISAKMLQFSVALTVVSAAEFSQFSFTCPQAPALHLSSRTPILQGRIWDTEQCEDTLKIHTWQGRGYSSLLMRSKQWGWINPKRWGTDLGTERKPKPFWLMGRHTRICLAWHQRLSGSHYSPGDPIKGHPTPQQQQQMVLKIHSWAA